MPITKFRGVKVNYNEYLKLVLESRLKTNKGDKVKTADEINMSLRSVIRYIEQFNLVKWQKKIGSKQK